MNKLYRKYVRELSESAWLRREPRQELKRGKGVRLSERGRERRVEQTPLASQERRTVGLLHEPSLA